MAISITNRLFEIEGNRYGGSLRFGRWGIVWNPREFEKRRLRWLSDPVDGYWQADIGRTRWALWREEPVQAQRSAIDDDE